MDPYSKYLQGTLGASLTRCLADVCQVRPEDPIEYMALWLYREADAEVYYYEKEIFRREMEQMLLGFHKEQERRQHMVKKINTKMAELQLDIKQKKLKQFSAFCRGYKNAYFDLSAFNVRPAPDFPSLVDASPQDQRFMKTLQENEVKDLSIASLKRDQGFMWQRMLTYESMVRVINTESRPHSRPQSQRQGLATSKQPSDWYHRQEAAWLSSRKFIQRQIDMRLSSFDKYIPQLALSSDESDSGQRVTFLDLDDEDITYIQKENVVADMSDDGHRDLDDSESEARSTEDDSYATSSEPSAKTGTRGRFYRIGLHKEDTADTEDINAFGNFRGERRISNIDGRVISSRSSMSDDHKVHFDEQVSPGELAMRMQSEAGSRKRSQSESNDRRRSSRELVGNQRSRSLSKSRDRSRSNSLSESRSRSISKNKESSPGKFKNKQDRQKELMSKDRSRGRSISKERRRGNAISKKPNQGQSSKDRDKVNRIRETAGPNESRKKGGRTLSWARNDSYDGAPGETQRMTRSTISARNSSGELLHTLALQLDESTYSYNLYSDMSCVTDSDSVAESQLSYLAGSSSSHSSQEHHRQGTAMRCHWSLENGVQLVCQHPVLGKICSKHPRPMGLLDSPFYWATQEFDINVHYDHELYSFTVPLNDTDTRHSVKSYVRRWRRKAAEVSQQNQYGSRKSSTKDVDN